MCDVLLAYVGADAAQADALAEALESLGFSVGDAHANDEEVRAAAARIVIWSQTAARSRALIGAAERFIGAGETVIASLVDPGVCATEELPVFDLSAWDGRPDDPRLDPLLDVIRRMLIVAGRVYEPVRPFDCALPSAAMPARVGAGWLADVPTSPPSREPWLAAMARTAAYGLAAAAQAAPKRSIMASLVIGSFLAGALLTGSLDRMGVLQATPSYAEAARSPVTAPVAFSAVAEAAPPRAAPADAAPPVQPRPPPLTARRASRPDAPDTRADDYVPPPYRSWEQPPPQPIEQAAHDIEPIPPDDYAPPPYPSWEQPLAPPVTGPAPLDIERLRLNPIDANMERIAHPPNALPDTQSDAPPLAFDQPQ